VGKQPNSIWGDKSKRSKRKRSKRRTRRKGRERRERRDKWSSVHRGRREGEESRRLDHCGASEEDSREDSRQGENVLTHTGARRKEEEREKDEGRNFMRRKKGSNVSRGMREKKTQCKFNFNIKF
jgi:hypothetical protein